MEDLNNIYDATGNEELPEVLKGAGRKPPFTVPEGYFDTFATRLYDRIEHSPVSGEEAEAGKGILVLFRSRRLRAIAASLAILLFSGLAYALVTEVIIPAIQRTPSEVVEPAHKSAPGSTESPAGELFHDDTDLSDAPRSEDIRPGESIHSTSSATAITGMQEPATRSSLTGRASPAAAGGAVHQTPPAGTIGQSVPTIPSFLRPQAPIGAPRTHFNDTVVCQGTQLVYRALEEPRSHEFTWYLNAAVLDRNTGPELQLNTSRLRQGTHRLSLVVTDKVNKNVVNVVNAGVVVAEPPSIPGEKTVCAYDRVVLNAAPQNPWWEYRWSTGLTTPELAVTSSGKYILTIRLKDGNCSVTDTFHVRILSKPTFDLEREQTLCAGDALRMEISDPLGQHRIRWSPGDHTGTLYTFNQEQPGRYVVRVEMTGCATVTEEVVVMVRDCRLRIPNFFTPNGDGINDLFEIKGLENYNRSRLVVNDRNGRVVFESNDYRNEWDGNSLPNGTYFYVLFPGGDEAAAIRGHVTIRR